MFNIDLIQIAVLWSIAGLALIGAINARSFFKAILSGFIVIGIIILAAVFSYIKLETVKKEIGFEESVPASPAVDSGSKPSENAKVATETAAICSPLEKRILEDAIIIADSILAFPKLKDINSQGIEKLETFESKALSLRNKSMDAYRQIRSLSRPGAENLCYYDLLLAAGDNLRLAGYETHRVFGYEQDYAGDNLSKAAVYAAQAKAVFLQLKELL
uniref:Uncharacterized protein n=1 Tax=uncultured bacterium contig00016 TaxID=1181507 RepID=A0A806KE38_9BACT|nr:hypothetical protein [uncultured bacterium contig00016]